MDGCLFWVRLPRHATDLLSNGHPPLICSIIIKAFGDFGRRGEEKHRRSAERIVKVWEDRRIFSPSLCESLKDALALPSPSAASVPSPSGPGGAGGGSSDHSKKLLQAAGKIPEALFEVLKAQHTSTSFLGKINQNPTDISLPSSTATIDQVTSAREAYASCLKPLQEELTIRRRAIAELKSCLSKQEQDLSTVEERYRSMDSTQGQLDQKIRYMSGASEGLPPSLSHPPHPPMPPPFQMISSGDGGTTMLPPSTEQIQAMLAHAASSYPPGVLPPPEVFFASLLNPNQGHGGHSSHQAPPPQHDVHQQQLPPPPFPPPNPGAGGYAYQEGSMGMLPIPTSAEEVEAQLMSHLQDPETRALVARSLAEMMPPQLPHPPHQGYAPMQGGSGRQNTDSVGFGSQLSVASGEFHQEEEYDPLNP